MKIATWNIKQAVAPKAKLPILWDYASQVIDADVMVFTEAKIPKEPIADEWLTIARPGGIDKKRQWGTVVASRKHEIRDITDGVSGLRGFKVNHTWPGTVTIADLIVDGDIYATIVGVYAITVDLDGNKTGAGHDSVPTIFDDLGGLISSRRGKRLIVAGDFNVWPIDMQDYLPKKLINVVEHTAGSRQPLFGCTGCSMGNDCGHMWTHKNGDSPNAKVQHLDNIFMSPSLVKDVISVKGGVADFPNAWDLSDHAPIVVEIEI